MGRVFLRNVLVVASGTALAQGLGVLAAPLLTRVYTPEDFGVLTTYTSILSMFLVMAALRYELAIPMPDDENEAYHLLILALLSLGVVTISVLLGIWFLGDHLVRWLHLPDIRLCLWLLPASLLGAGGYQVLNQWAVRHRAFGLISRTKLSQGISQLVTQLGLGILVPGSFGLLAGDAVGRISGSGTLARLAAKHQRAATYQFRPAKLWEVARRYSRFPLLSVASGLMNAAGLQLPPLLLTIFYGPGVSGSFSLGQRLLAAPLALIGMAVGQVFVGEISHLRRQNPELMSGLFHKTALRLLLLGAAPIAAIAIGGPSLFQWLLGSQWGQAGVFVRGLAVMLIVQFAVVPLSQTLNMLERQDWQLGWDAVRLVAVAGSLFGARHLGWSANSAILAYGLVMLVSYVGLYLLASLAIRRFGKQSA